MEASLRTFDAAKAPAAQPGHAPFPASPSSVKLPLAFMLLGLLSLFTGIGLLIVKPGILAGYHYNQHVIAVTHLFVLGWICSVVMGAMYQLVPVALETKLHSQKLAWWQFAFHAIGFIGMVGMFWIWDLKQVGHFGSAFAIGVGLFVYNLARTLWRVPKWNVTATAVTAALAWISLTVTAGLLVATAKCVNEIMLDPPAHISVIIRAMLPVAEFMGRFDALSKMHAHVHLGGVGCFVMLIVGVSYKLVPMFTLSEVQNRRRAAWSVALLNFGLAGSFATILRQSSWKPVFALIIIAALAIYARELNAILRARKRRPLDWGIKTFLAAIALLLPLSAIGVVLAWPGLPLTALTGALENLYGFIGFLGVISLAIIGMLYKILPFLVWFGSYSRQIGRAQVPSLAEMYSTRLQAAGYWTYLSGLAISSAGILAASEPVVRAGCALLALSLGTLALNTVKILGHFFKPQLKPLAFRAAPSPTPA